MSFRLRLSPLEQLLASGLLRILLTRISMGSNPGQDEFFCWVCAKRLHPNSTSVKCNTYNGWSLKTCSVLKTHREWIASYMASCCQRSTATPASTTIQIAPTMTNSLISPSAWVECFGLCCRSLPPQHHTVTSPNKITGRQPPLRFLQLHQPHATPSPPASHLDTRDKLDYYNSTATDSKVRSNR